MNTCVAKFNYDVDFPAITIDNKKRKQVVYSPPLSTKNWNSAKTYRDENEEMSDSSINSRTNSHSTSRRQCSSSSNESGESNETQSNDVQSSEINEVQTESSESNKRQQSDSSNSISDLYCKEVMDLKFTPQKYERFGYERFTDRSFKLQVAPMLGCVLFQLSKFDPLLCIPKTIFDGYAPPTIPISSYFLRVVDQCDCSIESAILSIIYLISVTKKCKNFQLNRCNVHRLILTCLLCAAKFNDDVHCNNMSFSRVGGVASREMNQLEVELLAALNFDVSVDYENFALYYTQLFDRLTHGNCNCNLDMVPAFPPQGNCETDYETSIAKQDENNNAKQDENNYENNVETKCEISYFPVLDYLILESCPLTEVQREASAGNYVNVAQQLKILPTNSQNLTVDSQNLPIDKQKLTVESQTAILLY